MSIGSRGIVARGASGVVTRDEFWQRVNALVGRLQARAPRRCALVCESSVDFAVGVVALAHLGCPIVLPPAPQAGSLRLCDADVDAVLTDMPDEFSGFDVVTFPAPVTR